MGYHVKYESKALKSLSKMDQSQRLIIIAWIEKNLVDTENPKRQGKSLKGNLGDYWRYRLGSYRIIAKIQDQEIEIIIVDVGHRKNIYE